MKEGSYEVYMKVLLWSFLCLRTVGQSTSVRNVSSVGPQLNVAFCFVGNFIRHSSLMLNISSHMGDPTAVYDGFIATSTQHDELDPRDSVSTEEICNNLLSKGFSHCTAELIPYNGSMFRETVRELGDYQSNSGLYPHRTASFFSSIARCMRLVQEAQQRLLAAGQGYDFIFVTRLDVINNIFVKPADKSWWRKVHKFDLVGVTINRNSNRRPEIYDRFFFGGFSFENQCRK